MLTVFITTRNGAATLPRVLGAYLGLRPPPGGWKLVVVDNGSADDTPAILRSFADRLPLVVLREPRPGKNRALNRALAELEGDLAVFSDDDALPDPDWLVALREAVDRRPAYDVFGGSILPAWDGEPEAWVREWVPAMPVYGVHDEARADGACEPTRVFGTNMAVRAKWFRAGYRFDEQLGPNGTATYAMGSETEFSLRLVLNEQVACWHCAAARVHHIIRARQLTRAFVLRRAFHLGRCVKRESRQRAAAGHPHVPRGAAAILRGLGRNGAALLAAQRAGDARRAFEARWQLNLWCGCLYEALGSSYKLRDPLRDAVAHA